MESLRRTDLRERIWIAVGSVVWVLNSAGAIRYLTDVGTMPIWLALLIVPLLVGLVCALAFYPGTSSGADIALAAMAVYSALYLAGADFA